MPALAAIIMRSKNEMPHVRAALEQLGRQTLSDIELYAVDSGSTDGSLEELRTHCNHLIQIEPETYHPGNVLNEAIERAHHPIIVLLNADAIPVSVRWLETLLAPLLENQADATFSRQRARPDAPFIVAYDYERAYAPEHADGHSFSAVACAFKRELWEQHKFRPTGYAEDFEWASRCIARGARFQYVKDSIVEHSHTYPLKELFRKRYRQALTFPEVPNLGTRIYACARELARDLLHAARKLKPHTIPYNIAYRVTIHAGIHKGLKDGEA